VPALMAMQSDLAHQIASARRALAHPRRHGAVGVATVSGLVGLGSLFAVTLGSQIVLGAPLLPFGPSGLVGSAVIFLAGSGGLLLVIYLSVGALRLRKA